MAKFLDLDGLKRFYQKTKITVCGQSAGADKNIALSASDVGARPDTWTPDSLVSSGGYARINANADGNTVPTMRYYLKEEHVGGIRMNPTAISGRYSRLQLTSKDFSNVCTIYTSADPPPVTAVAAQNAANIDYLSMMAGIELPDAAPPDTQGG